MKSSIAALLLLLCGLGWAADEGGTEAKLGKIRQKIADIQKDIQERTSQRDSMAARLRDAELTVSGSRRKLEELRSQRAASDKRRAELQNQKQEVENALAAQRAALAGQLRAAHMMGGGRQEQLKLLLNQQDPAQLGRMFAYYSYFGRVRATKIDVIKEQLAQVLALDQQLAAENEELVKLEALAKAELNSFKRARAQRNRVLADLDNRLKGNRQQLARLKREEDTLEKLLAELRRAMSDFPLTSDEPFEKTKGKLRWPVQGKVVADFGQKRSAGLNWNGVMLATERGSPVQAVYFGRVIYADWLAGLGLLTIVEHSGGYLSLYGHNDQLYKSVGDWVKPGETIASAGDSGGRSRPELYFEIRKGSKPLNPRQWVRK